MSPAFDPGAVPRRRQAPLSRHRRADLPPIVPVRQAGGNRSSGGLPPWQA